MKFNKPGQLLLVSVLSLMASGLVIACGTNTVDFVYVASSKAAGPNSYGEIDVLEVNRRSGYMRPIPTSPFPSGGRNPVAEAVSQDYSNLYVVNQDDNTIVQFIIGNDGKLYPQSTVNTPGIFPLAAVINGSYLFVVDTFQPLPGCFPSAPCSGSLAVLPILAASDLTNGSLGAPVANGILTYWPLSLPGKPNDILEPLSINVLGSGSYLYVTAYDSTTSANYIFGFSVGAGGALSALNGGAPFGGTPYATGACPTVVSRAPYSTGTCPSALASDPAGTFLYVADAKHGSVHVFAIGVGGALSEINGSPFKAGDQPYSLVVDPSGKFLYVADAEDSNITAYSISNGTLTNLGFGTYATGLQPVAIGFDVWTGQYLYTVNFLGGSVSGFQMNLTDGSLINTQLSPYRTDALPTAMAAIPHGSAAK